MKRIPGTLRLQRTVGHYALLAETAEALLRSRDPYGVIQHLCTQVMHHLECDVFFNFLLVPPGHIQLNAYAGVPPEVAANLKILELDTSICGCVVQDSARIVANDIQNSTDVRVRLVRSLGIQAYCCHPILIGGKAVGSISFGTKRRTSFGEDEIEIMRAVAGQVAIAIDRIRTDAALSESERRLQIAKDAAALAIYDYDVVADVSSWDALMREFWDFGPDEVVTYKTFLAGIHPDDRPIAEAARAKAMDPDGDGHCAAEYRVIGRNNRRERWISATGCVLFHERRPIRVIGTMQDITERKRTENERKRLAEQRQLALNAASMGWWHYDPATKISTWDDRYGEILQVDGCQAPNEELLSQIHPEDLPGVKAKAEQALNPLTSKPFNAEFRVRLKDCTYRWVEAHGLASFEGEGESRHPASFVGTVRDITERKRIENSLTEADRKKNDFLAMLSHELRNPMAAISSAAAVLSLPSLTPHDADFAREALKQRVKQLARLVDDMLDVTRIIRGKIELHKEVLTLADVVKGAVEATKSNFKERGTALNVEVDGSLRVLGDSVRLEQVTNNLLTNAARYTDKGGQVSLRVAEENGMAVLRVKDNGVGIPADLIAQIFDLFAQADNTLHRSSGGLGVGLSIVKTLVEMHGGAVTAFSEGPGRGSEFVVRLPLHEDSVRQGRPDRLKPVVPALSILLAEDNRDTAEMTAALLAREGHEVEVVFDGRAALDRALEQSFDVLLLDLGLPELSGFEVACELRAQGMDELLIVAVSGYGFEQDIERARTSGIDYHLLKPIDFERLTEILSRWTERQSAGTLTEQELASAEELQS